MSIAVFRKRYAKRKQPALPRYKMGIGDRQRWREQIYAWLTSGVDREEVLNRLFAAKVRENDAEYLVSYMEKVVKRMQEKDNGRDTE